MKTVYVDNNATTKVAPEVLEAMLPYFSELYGNPSSMHFFGGQVQKKVDEAREKVADFLGAEASEVVFTSCGTESDNAAILGTLDSYPEKRHLITTRVEHPAVGNLSTYLGRKGYRVTELSVDREGRLDLDELREAITEETTIVTIMYANNETGVIFPVEEVGEIVKAKGIPFHTDAVQAAGKISLNLKKSTIDMLSISGHKLHAPKGIGVLFIRKGTKFSPFLIGGHQEKGRRGGTENVPYIIGLGKACELAKKSLNEENTRVKALRDYLEAKLLEKIPNTLVNGDRKNRLPNTVSVSFEYVEGESIPCCFRILASVPLQGRPVRLAPSNLRTFSEPWVSPSRLPMVPSVSAFPFIIPRRRWITSSNISLLSFRDYGTSHLSGRTI